MTDGVEHVIDRLIENPLVEGPLDEPPTEEELLEASFYPGNLADFSNRNFVITAPDDIQGLSVDDLKTLLREPTDYALSAREFAITKLALIQRLKKVRKSSE